MKYHRATNFISTVPHHKAGFAGRTPKQRQKIADHFLSAVDAALDVGEHIQATLGAASNRCRKGRCPAGEIARHLANRILSHRFGAVELYHIPATKCALRAIGWPSEQLV